MKHMLLAFFVTGLLGSPHCMAMCGGFVAAYAMRGRGWAVASHAVFHAGRMITAITLGLLAGLFGWGVNRTTGAVGVHGAFTWIFGALMIAIGMIQLGPLPLDHIIPSFSRRLERPMSALLGKAARGQGLVPVLALGLMIGLLPCHLSYGALGMAADASAGTGSVWMGPLGMLLFVLGTTPLLLVFGIASRGLGAALRDRVVRVAAVVLIAMGVWTIYRTWPSATPPCCHEMERSSN